MDFEQEIVQLRRERTAKEAEYKRERAAAEKVVEDLRESGADPLDKDNFAKVDEAFKRSDSLRDELAEVDAKLRRVLEIAGEKATESHESIERSEARDIVGRFLESGEYRRLVNDGRLRNSAARVDTAPVEVATRDELVSGLRFRATVDNTAGSGGGLIWSDRLGLVVPIPERSVRLLDVITVGTTDSDTVEWAFEKTRTHAAAETAYGVDAPEAEYGYDKRSTTVKRIPHFVPATKGALADGGQLRTLLEASLMKGVRLRVENQVLKGDGTGENLAGIMDDTYTIGTVALGEDSRFDAVHKAITKVRVSYFDEPGVIGMHPNDYERVVLEKDSAGNYVHGRSVNELSTIWGLTPVVSTVFTEGTPLVGDYSQAILWVREGLSIAASDSHADFFRKGLVALLAEMRAAFAVIEEKAFCSITGFNA